VFHLWAKQNSSIGDKAFCGLTLDEKIHSLATSKDEDDFPLLAVKCKTCCEKLGEHIQELVKKKSR